MSLINISVFEHSNKLKENKKEIENSCQQLTLSVAGKKKLLRMVKDYSKEFCDWLILSDYAL